MNSSLAPPGEQPRARRIAAAAQPLGETSLGRGVITGQLEGVAVPPQGWGNPTVPAGHRRLWLSSQYDQGCTPYLKFLHNSESGHD